MLSVFSYVYYISLKLPKQLVFTYGSVLTPVLTQILYFSIVMTPVTPIYFCYDLKELRVQRLAYYWLHRMSKCFVFLF